MRALGTGNEEPAGGVVGNYPQRTTIKGNKINCMSGNLRSRQVNSASKTRGPAHGGGGKKQGKVSAQ